MAMASKFTFEEEEKREMLLEDRGRQGTLLLQKPHDSWSEVIIRVGIGLGQRKRTIQKEKFEKEGEGLQGTVYGESAGSVRRIESTVLQLPFSPNRFPDITWH